MLEVYDSEQGQVLIGYYIPDFVVADLVVVEIKVLKGLNSSHVAQVIGYLAVTGRPVGLLINFGRRSMEWQRILPPKDVVEHRVNRQWLFVPDWLRKEDEQEQIAVGGLMVGERLVRQALDFQESLIAAGLRPGDERRALLKHADVQLVQLRQTLRLCKDLNLISLGKYEHAAGQVVEICKLLGGWLKKA